MIRYIQNNHTHETNGKSILNNYDDSKCDFGRAICFGGDDSAIRESITDQIRTYILLFFDSQVNGVSFSVFTDKK